MATRGNRPKDPRGTKGGVRGTHGLGDAPREKSEERPVGTRGGTAVTADGDHSGGTLHPSHTGMRAEAPRKRAAHGSEHVDRSNREPGPIEADAAIEEIDESVGEEREFELSNAMAELESADTWADRRERTARAVLESERRHADSGIEENDLAAWEVDSGADGVLGDPRYDRQERRDRGLDTVKTHGPGPKDEGKGTARTKDLEERRLERR